MAFFDHRRRDVRRAVVGALTIARWRVLAVVVATLWVGAIISGYVFDALTAGKLY